MAGEIKTSRPIIETLKGLNVDSPEALNAILKDASVGLQWEKAVMDSTANPQQLQSALGIIHAMNTGDPGLQRKALDAMLGECKAVAERLGVQIDGLTGDVLDKHPDLKQAVEAMDITRDHALELARRRAAEKNYEQRDLQAQQRAQQQAEAQRLEQVERQRVDELSETLKASDPHFAAKLATMQQNGTIAKIAALPWNQRYEALLRAYRETPAPAPAPAPAPPRVRPSQITNRGNNVSATGVARREFNSDMEAFEFGVESVSGRR
jgi:hypothetical protein